MHLTASMCVGLLYDEIMEKNTIMQWKKKATYSLHIRKTKNQATKTHTWYV